MLFAQTAFGQAKDHVKGNKIENRIKRLDTQLNLTDDQEQKLKDIYQSHAEKLKTNREKSEALKKERREEMKAMRKEMRAVLTPDQVKKLESIQAEKSKEHVQKKADMKVSELDAKVKLTEDQKTKLRSTFIQHMSAMKAIKEQTTSTPDLGKERIKTERKELHKDVKAILTPEQQKILKEEKGKKKELKSKGWFISFTQG